MVAEARIRHPGLARRIIRADGHALPLRDGAVDGCRIERVLQHVVDPAAVVREASRVLRPGGFLALFEPDWTTLHFDTDLGGADAIGAVLHRPRHPDVGARLAPLVEANGCEVLDEVTEASRSESIDHAVLSLDRLVPAAVARGALDAQLAGRWLAEQRARGQIGRFRAYWSKMLVIGRRR